jgi:hypothetical protein
MKTYSFEDVMIFGKYNGKKIAWIYRNDIQYLAWLIQETDFKMSAENERLVLTDNERDKKRTPAEWEGFFLAQQKGEKP